VFLCHREEVKNQRSRSGRRYLERPECRLWIHCGYNEMQPIVNENLITWWVDVFDSHLPSFPPPSPSLSMTFCYRYDRIGATDYRTIDERELLPFVIFIGGAGVTVSPQGVYRIAGCSVDLHLLWFQCDGLVGSQLSTYVMTVQFRAAAWLTVIKTKCQASRICIVSTFVAGYNETPSHDFVPYPIEYADADATLCYAALPFLANICR
jgi:hypothetical protein